MNRFLIYYACHQDVLNFRSTCNSKSEINIEKCELVRSKNVAVVLCCFSIYLVLEKLPFKYISYTHDSLILLIIWFALLEGLDLSSFASSALLIEIFY